MKTAAVIAVAFLWVAAQAASGIDYKKNTISGSGGSNSSTFSSFSSSTTFQGSNFTTTCSGTPTFSSEIDYDWGDGGFGQKTLDQRIRDAEQRLNKLYFIRDVCRTLEDEIRISFEKKDLREVLAQVSEILGTPLPYTAPEGTFLVEKSEVSGMPADQFLRSIAQVCGLTLTYERNKLVFAKTEKPSPAAAPSSGAEPAPPPER